LPKLATASKYFFLILSCAAIFLVSGRVSFNFVQSVSLTIFSASVLATLIFWKSRVAISFLGIAGLILTKTIDIKHLILFSSLEVILFLVGMMVIVGLLREVNFFNWILCRLVTFKGMTGKKMVIVLCVTSALMACLVDEVTSIIFMISLIFVLADYFDANPLPFLIITVMSTNIGSTGTVLGNPIGILIATKAGLTFEDFLLKAFPLMLLVLGAAIAVLLWWYREEIRKLDTKIKEMGNNREAFARLICVPMTKEIKNEFFLFSITLLCIGLHHRLEQFFSLPTNALLLSMPLISAAIIMLWHQEKAREYIEKDVDWWTLIFFMLLFAKVGTLKYTGVTDIFSNGIAKLAGDSQFFIITFVLWAAAIGSSILDNVVLVATFLPVIDGLRMTGIDVASLWWALLFGGCLGGNITMVGSTANIVAIGMMEKRNKRSVSFLEWLKISLVIGIITTTITWVFLLSFRRFFSC